MKLIGADEALGVAQKAQQQTADRTSVPLRMRESQLWQALTMSRPRRGAGFFYARARR